MRRRELERGMTLIGPHRDDLHFFVNGYDIQTYGSQGQQRTTALSLKLAEIELVKQEVGEAPVLTSWMMFCLNLMIIDNPIS